MAQIEQVLKALQRDPGSARRAQRWSKFFQFVLVLCFVAFLLFIIWQGYEQLWNFWQTGEGDHTTGTVLSILAAMQLFLQAGRAAALFNVGARVQRGAQLLRQMLESGDTTWAPLAKDQPASPLQSAWQSDEGRIGPLRRLAVIWTGRVVTETTLFLVVLIAVILGALGALVIGTDNSAGVRIEPSVVAMLIAGLGGGVILLVLLWRDLRRLLRPMYVAVDEWSIRWSWPGWRRREAAIVWNQARAFYVAISRPVPFGTPRSIYVLEGPDATLMWDAPLWNTVQRSAAEQLARLVALRTHLPLRDISAAVERISEPPKRPTKRAKRAALNPSAVIATDVPALSEPAGPWQTITPHSKAMPRLALTLGLISVLLIGLLTGAGWFLQRYQPHYYASLPAKIHHLHPLFADSMAGDDGKWPIHEPDSSDSSRYVYENGAYHMSGGQTGYTLEQQLNDAIFSDAAVEASVQQVGSTDNDGVGLLVQVDAHPSEEVAYVVSPTTGTWWLGRYNSESNEWDMLIDTQQSSAINVGPGAVNRLLVVMRGSLFLCYINNQFVGSVYDWEYADTPPGLGYVGFYVNNGGTTEGIFSNLAVYPVKPPSSFEYV